MVDLPTYRFEPSTGVLSVYGGNPRLDVADVGYYGSGASIASNGSGAGSRLHRIVALPFEGEDTRILNVDDTGAIAFTLEGDPILLRLGSEQRWQSVGPGDRENCVITTSLRISNFGFQDRTKIVYR